MDSFKQSAEADVATELVNAGEDAPSMACPIELGPRGRLAQTTSQL